MFMFFLLKPLTKPGYRDVTMQALYFLSRGEVKHSDESVLPVTKKEGKRKWTIGPRMKNGRANVCLISNFVTYPLCFLAAYSSDVTSQLFSREREGASDSKNPDLYYLPDFRSPTLSSLSRVSPQKQNFPYMYRQSPVKTNQLQNIPSNNTFHIFTLYLRYS